MGATLRAVLTGTDTLAPDLMRRAAPGPGPPETMLGQ
jgi:hypothetical protein